MFCRKELSMSTAELTQKVEDALEEIRPFLQSDGGDISLLGIDDDRVVRVQLQGACVGCSVNQMTLKSGVEMTIKKHAPQIEQVINVVA
jgi:Fe-S cluster biogenesis protein NfuA|nr:nitrogen fixation protein NifU [uncultured bacterium]